MKMKTAKKFISMLLVTAMFAFTTACGAESSAAAESSKSGAEEKEVAGASRQEPEADTLSDPNYSFKWIVNNTSEIITADIAIKTGAFEKAGINVEVVGIAGGGAASVQTVASGEADFGWAAIPAYINGVAGGSKIKVIYGGPASAHANDPSNQILVAADSDIDSAEDLINKTVAVGAKGAMWEYIVRIYLKNAGLDPDQLDMIIVPNAQHEQVLKSGQVDAVVDNTPFADEFINNGTAKTLATYYDVVGEKEAGNGWGVIMNTDTLASRPAEAVTKLIQVLIDTDEWVEANPDEAREVVRQILADREQNTDIADYWHPFHLVDHGLWTEEHVKFWINFMEENGTIDKGEILPSDIYTNEYNPYYVK